MALQSKEMYEQQGRDARRAEQERPTPTASGSWQARAFLAGYDAEAITIAKEHVKNAEEKGDYPAGWRTIDGGSEIVTAPRVAGKSPALSAPYGSSKLRVKIVRRGSAFEAVAMDGAETMIANIARKTHIRKLALRAGYDIVA